MAPQLIRMHGDTQERAYPINKAQLTMGRAPESDIQLESKFASRLHAELHYGSGVYTLYVPDGKQVAVNGAPVTGQVRLNPGDTIDFPEERFLFGEVRTEVGARPKAKIEPIRILIPIVIVGMLVGFGWNKIFPKTYAEPPAELAVDVEQLRAITNRNPELASLRKDIFYRGDYLSALTRLRNEVGSSVTPEEKKAVEAVILALVMRQVANQFVAGEEHYKTKQYESARTNFQTITRLRPAFEGADTKIELPPHPRLVDADGYPVLITLEDAVKTSLERIESCDALLANRPDPHAAPPEPAAG